MNQVEDAWAFSLPTPHPPPLLNSRPLASLVRARADKQVIGTISRLAPTQAHLSIQISNSRPVPESSEEFTGVIRLADIRLTERDKIKMGDCFRLGDLVKARVVRGLLSLFLLPFYLYVIWHYQSCERS
jgi:hypothetical protein